ncbi:BrnA antitoxin family protein [Rhodovulum sp. ES.010]|uniref:BrnA antitoxin family protein n=1 Tax=Rhodovulum sp. ES.010 TaxID=1882821 RepID=UPI00158805F4|nr:BrnA antitoxin family protein [Rhodovulum sp. ES.010]
MFDPRHLGDPHPIRPRAERKLTKGDLKQLAAAQEAIMRLHMFVYGREMEALHVPEAWHLLPEIYPANPKKVKITLLLEEPVAKFYRANGKGYQALINDVLKAYAQLRLAKVIEGLEDKGPSGEPV